MGIPVLKQTTAYRVEKGVPVPAPRGKYPFGDMDVGDSFYTEDKTRLVSAASYYGTRNNKKFSIRKDGTGWRCWRIA